MKHKLMTSTINNIDYTWSDFSEKSCEMLIMGSG